MKYILNITILMFCFTISHRQEHEEKTGTIQQVITEREYILVDENDNYFTIFLNDSKLNKSKSKEVLAYVKSKILNKKVYFFVEKKEHNFLAGTILYNYEDNIHIDKKKDIITTSEGNILNIELLKRKYIIYTGSNDFLKEISNSSD